MKSTIISIIIAVVLIGGAIIFTRKNNESTNTSTTTKRTENVQNVSIVDGKQIIEIKAKGGYTPRKSIAKAGIPTILKIDTNGTFDCSSSVRIPSMGIFKNLPQTGVTDIDLGNGQPGILKGTCGMGMYPFQIEFQ